MSSDGQFVLFDGASRDAILTGDDLEEIHDALEEQLGIDEELDISDPWGEER